MKCSKYKSILDITAPTIAYREYKRNRVIKSFKYHIETKQFGPKDQIVIDWCEDNCREKFSVCWSMFMFETQEDAVLFQLTWLND